MSRLSHALRLATVALPLLLAVPERSVAAPTHGRAEHAARAQVGAMTRDDSPEARVRRLQRLDVRRRALDATRKQERASATASWFTDTVQAGVFRIATTRALRDRVRGVAAGLSRDLQHAIDTAVVDSLQRHLVLVRHALPEERRWIGPQALVVSYDASYEFHGFTGRASLFLRDNLRDELTRLLIMASNRTMDDAARGWLFNTSVSGIAPSAEVEARARMEVATAGSFAARRCVVGDLAACATLLSLRGRPVDPLRAWYVPEDYHDLAGRLRLAPQDGDVAPRLQRRCLARDTAACSTLVRLLDPDRLPAPTLEAPRLVLLHEALRLGGDGAITRLRSTHGDIGTRLAAAAGVREDSLVSIWRRRVIAQRGSRIRPTSEVALATIGWTLLLTGFSLRRTRRCL